MPSALPPTEVKVHPSDENYFLVPKTLMTVGTGIFSSVILVTSDKPITGQNSPDAPIIGKHDAVIRLVACPNFLLLCVGHS